MHHVRYCTAVWYGYIVCKYISMIRCTIPIEEHNSSHRRSQNHLHTTSTELRWWWRTSHQVPLHVTKPECNRDQTQTWHPASISIAQRNSAASSGHAAKERRASLWKIIFALARKKSITYSTFFTTRRRPSRLMC